jgi:putative aldouronate transport system permease protein
LRRKHKLKQFSGIGDTILLTIIYSFLVFILIVILVPMMNIVASSFSSPTAVSSGRVGIFPVDFSLIGYQAVFKNSHIVTGFLNSLIYMVLGTFINLVVTLFAAYPLARRDLIGRKTLTFLFSFTMLFSGGMIPTYLVVRSLGMVDTMWAMIIPGALSVYNIVLARTFMQSSIPYELYESAQIDGCSYAGMFFRITLPLSKALIAVLTLMFAVGHWNSYFSALMYLRSQKLFPLQLVLRQILILNEFNLAEMSSTLVDDMIQRQFLANLLKYSMIVIASVPVMILYPFIQGYFVKGVMLGSLKG